MINYKKTIIISVVVLVVLVVIITVLSQLSGPNVSTNDFSGGIMAPNGSSLPSGSLSEPSIKSSAVAPESLSSPAPVSNTASTITDKKIIKDGDLSLKVSSADQAVQDIASIAKNNGGEVFSSNIYNRNNIKSGVVAVKVPVANFEKTFAEIKKVASLVIQESTSGQDVTEQYADLQAQLKNKQAEEQQFVQILGQAQKIQDILDVTQQLSQVRGEIEQLQGRIKFMDSQTDMSSISVSLSEDENITISDTWRPWQLIKDSVNSLIKKTQGFINFAIVLIITVIPVAVLYLLLIYVIYRVVRKIYLKAKNYRTQDK